jgi:hypothetical protein
MYWDELVIIGQQTVAHIAIAYPSGLASGQVWTTRNIILVQRVVGSKRRICSHMPEGKVEAVRTVH